jgi:hypothetical protein
MGQVLLSGLERLGMPLDYSHWRGKPKRACFDCHKCFKDRTYHHRYEITTICPNCGGKLHKMGTLFKAPRHNDTKAWEAIKMLYDAGVRYDVFDMHQHYWPERYIKYGDDFETFVIGEVIARTAYLQSMMTNPGTIGIMPPHPQDEPTVPPRAMRTERFRPETQWSGPRPTHPREVPAFLKWWHERNLDRIAVLVEACEKLGYEPPEGLRGELLLEEMRKRFNSGLK